MLQWRGDLITLGGQRHLVEHLQGKIQRGQRRETGPGDNFGIVSFHKGNICSRSGVCHVEPHQGEKNELLNRRHVIWWNLFPRQDNQIRYSECVLKKPECGLP